MVHVETSDNEEQCNVSVPVLSLDQLLAARKQSQPLRKRKKPVVPTTAFMLYVRRMLGCTAHAHPELTPKDVVKVVECNWLNLPSKERREFLDLSMVECQMVADAEAAEAASALIAASVLVPKKRKRNTPVKDVAMPKHPKSAFLHFAAANRKRVKETAKSFTDVAKQLGLVWKSLSDDAKSSYQSLAEKDKIRYRREKKLFELAPLRVEPPSDEQDFLDNKRRRKHPKAPKHPLSAYLFFVATHRAHLTAKYTGKTFTEIARMLGFIWRRINKDEKRKYQILAEADKRRYKYEMDQWSEPVLVDQAAPLGQHTHHSSALTSANASSTTNSVSSTCNTLHSIASAFSKPNSKESDCSTNAANIVAAPVCSSSLAVATTSDSASGKTCDTVQPTVHPPIDTMPQTKVEPKPRKKKRKVMSMDSMVSKRHTSAMERHQSMLRRHHEASRVAAARIVKQALDCGTSAHITKVLSEKAFKLFMVSEREAVLEVHPNIDDADLNKALQSMWCELSEHEKATYTVETSMVGWTTQESSTSTSSHNATDLSTSSLSDRVAVENWDAERIGEFVAKSGFAQHVKTFVASGLSGADLASLTTLKMKTDLNIHKLSDRKRLRTAFDELLDGQIRMFKYDKS